MKTLDKIASTVLPQYRSQVYLTMNDERGIVLWYNSKDLCINSHRICALLLLLQKCDDKKTVQIICKQKMTLIFCTRFCLRASEWD